MTLTPQEVLPKLESLTANDIAERIVKVEDKIARHMGNTESVNYLASLYTILSHKTPLVTTTVREVRSAMNYELKVKAEEDAKAKEDSLEA